MMSGKAFPPRKGDLPRDELLKAAQEAVDQGASKVYFKYTCRSCGARCVLDEPNMLRESGECYKCGAVTQIGHGGFMVLFDFKPDKKEDTGRA